MRQKHQPPGLPAGKYAGVLCRIQQELQGVQKGEKQMTHEATIKITLDTETGEVNFRFDFEPEADVENLDSNKAAVIAAKMYQLLKDDGVVE